MFLQGRFWASLCCILRGNWPCRFLTLSAILPRSLPYFIPLKLPKSALIGFSLASCQLHNYFRSIHWIFCSSVPIQAGLAMPRTSKMEQHIRLQPPQLQSQDIHNRLGNQIRNGCRRWQLARHLQRHGPSRWWHIYNSCILWPFEGNERVTDSGNGGDIHVKHTIVDDAQVRVVGVLGLGLEKHPGSSGYIPKTRHQERLSWLIESPASLNLLETWVSPVTRSCYLTFFRCNLVSLPQTEYLFRE